MEKKIYALLLVFVISCSKDDDCQDKINEINAKYDSQVQYVKTHPGLNGIDYVQINLLNEERNRKLSQACN